MCISKPLLVRLCKCLAISIVSHKRGHTRQSGTLVGVAPCALLFHIRKHHRKPVPLVLYHADVSWGVLHATTSLYGPHHPLTLQNGSLNCWAWIQGRPTRPTPMRTSSARSCGSACNATLSSSASQQTFTAAVYCANRGPHANNHRRCRRPSHRLQDIENVEQGVSVQRGTLDSERQALETQRQGIEAQRQSVEAEAQRLTALETELKAR